MRAVSEAWRRDAAFANVLYTTAVGKVGHAEIGRVTYSCVLLAAAAPDAGETHPRFITARDC